MKKEEQWEAACDIAKDFNMQISNIKFRYEYVALQI